MTSTIVTVLTVVSVMMVVDVISFIIIIKNKKLSNKLRVIINKFLNPVNETVNNDEECYEEECYEEEDTNYYKINDEDDLHRQIEYMKETQKESFAKIFKAIYELRDEVEYLSNEID
jgi:hypothetical protein